MNLVYEEPNHRPRSQGQRLVDVLIKLSYLEVRTEAEDVTQEEALHLWRLIEPYYRSVCKRAKWNDLARKMRLIKAATQVHKIACPGCRYGMLISGLASASDIFRCERCGIVFNGARVGLRDEHIFSPVEWGGAWMASIYATSAVSSGFCPPQGG